MCILGFPWAQGYLCTNLDVIPANLPSIWIRLANSSVFHWYDHLATIFVPSVELENVISHIEALVKFTQKALNDSNQAISLPNSEVPMIRKAILQNCMVLDILTASQRGTCVIIQTECYVYIPDESSNGDVLGRWFGFKNSWLKSLFVTLIMLLAILLIIYLFYKIDIFCVTWCITRSLAKLIIVKHLKGIAHIYNVK